MASFIPMERTTSNNIFSESNNRQMKGNRSSNGRSNEPSNLSNVILNSKRPSIQADLKANRNIEVSSRQMKEDCDFRAPRWTESIDGLVSKKYTRIKSLGIVYENLPR